MRILSHILKHKNLYSTFKTIQNKYAAKYYKITIKNTDLEDNPFGINLLNKTRGIKYGIIHSTLTVGQKTTIYYI